MIEIERCKCFSTRLICLKKLQKHISSLIFKSIPTYETLIIYIHTYIKEAPWMVPIVSILRRVVFRSQLQFWNVSYKLKKLKEQGNLLEMLNQSLQSRGEFWSKISLSLGSVQFNIFFIFCQLKVFRKIFRNYSNYEKTSRGK